MNAPADVIEEYGYTLTSYSKHLPSPSTSTLTPFFPVLPPPSTASCASLSPLTLILDLSVKWHYTVPSCNHRQLQCLVFYMDRYGPYVPAPFRTSKPTLSPSIIDTRSTSASYVVIHVRGMLAACTKSSDLGLSATRLSTSCSSWHVGEPRQKTALPGLKELVEAARAPTASIIPEPSKPRM